MTTFRNQYPLPQKVRPQSPLGQPVNTVSAGSYVSRSTPPQTTPVVQPYGEPAPYQRGGPEVPRQEAFQPAPDTPDFASEFDELDRGEEMAAQADAVDPLIRSAFVESEQPSMPETDPMRMNPAQFAADRERGMNVQPTSTASTSGSFDDWLDKTYQMTPVVRYGFDTGRRLLKPGTGTEIATRSMGRFSAQGTPERQQSVAQFAQPVDVNAMSVGVTMKPVQEPTTFLGKTGQAFRDGLAATQSSLNGLSALGANVGPLRVLAPSVSEGIVRRTSDYAQFIGKDIAHQPSESAATNYYYALIGAIPNLALQVGAAIATGGSSAAYAVLGGGVSAGDQFNQSVNEYARVVQDANPGMTDEQAIEAGRDHAAVEALLAGSITTITEKIPGEQFFGKAAERGIKGLTGTVLAKAFARKAVVGAAAESSQEFLENFSTDIAVHLYREMRPEWESALKDDPRWMERSFTDAIWSAAVAAPLGGAMGAVSAVAHYEPPNPTTTEQEIRSSVKAEGAKTPRKVEQVVARLAEHEPAIVRSFMDDLASQRRIASALDMSGLTDDELGKIAAGAKKDATARLAGGALKEAQFVVTPEMAAQEIVRRSKGEPQRIVGGPLRLSEDGTVSDDAVADWKARNPEMAQNMATAPSLSRRMVERIVGREFGGNSAEFRKELHGKIRSVDPSKTPQEIHASDIAEELTGLPRTQAMLVMAGLSPQSAKAVEDIRAIEAERGPVGSDSTDAQLDEIARLNGLQPDDIREVTDTTPDEREAQAFARKRGVDVRYFVTRGNARSNAATFADGTVWINAAADAKERRMAIAMHEVSDLASRESPDLFDRADEALRQQAPDALNRAKAKYAADAREQGTSLSSGDIRREGVSIMFEGLADAYALHLAVDGSGRFDVDKARKLVGANPSIVARFVAALQKVLVSLGVVKEDARLRRLREYVGSGTELESANVRAFVAQQLGSVLNGYVRERGARSGVMQSLGNRDDAKAQRRIDMAFQMGRRPGLVAGEVQGQMTGERNAGRIAKAEKRKAIREERAASRRRAADARARLNERMEKVRRRIVKASTIQKRINAAYGMGRQSGLIAGQIEGQKQGRKDEAKAALKRLRKARQAVRDELRAILKDASAAVQELPMRERGRFSGRLAKATTIRRMERLVMETEMALALVPVRHLRSEVARQTKKAKKWGMMPDTRGVVDQLHKDAMAVLSGADGKIVKYTGEADLQMRTATAQRMLASAQAAAEADKMAYKAAKAARAVRNKELIAGFRDDLLAKKPLAEGRHVGDPQSSFAQMVFLRGSADMHTMVHLIEGGGGGALSEAVASLQAGEVAKQSEAAEIRKEMDTLLAPDFRDRHEYDLKAGKYGTDGAEIVTVRLGGADRKMTLGTAMRIAAQDDHAVKRLVEVGFVPSSNRDIPAIIPTESEILAVRARYAPIVDRVKKAVEKRLQERYFAAYFEQNGRTAPLIPGYFKTARLNEPVGEVDPATPGQLASGMFRQADDQFARTGGTQPFVIGDFMDGVDQMVDGHLTVIHLAAPSRQFMTMISDRTVANAMDRAYGPKMREKFREWLLNGLGIGRGQGTPFDRAIAAMTGAAIANNIKTMLRQPGGVFKAAAEIGPGAMAAGVARLSTIVASAKERRALLDAMMRNGYFIDRWESSQVGRMAGLEGGKGADMRRIAVAMKAAGAAAMRAGRDARSLKLASAMKSLGQALGASLRATRAIEYPLRTMDQIVASAVVLGYESQGMSRDQAVAMTEQTFRRTQNASSRFDDSFLASTAKVRGGGWGLAKLLFPFSSDAIKSYNMAARAFNGGSLQQRVRTTFALAGNSLWAAAVNPALLAAGYALAVGLGDDKDKEMDGALAKALADESLTDAQGRVANDIMSSTMGYFGLMAGNVVESAIRGKEPDFGSQIVPARELTMLGKAIGNGDAANTARYGALVAGSPVLVPVLQVSDIAAKVSPDEEEQIKILSRRRTEGTATRAQLVLLARLTAKRDAAYAQSRRTGEMDDYQRARYEREQKRRAARIRQAEALREGT